MRNVLIHPTTTLPVIIASHWARYIDAWGGARRMVLGEQRVVKDGERGRWRAEYEEDID